MAEEDEQKDLISNQYRITPEVKDTIFLALNVLEQLPIKKDIILINRARNDLNFPLTLTGQPDTKDDIKSPIVVSDQLRDANFKNTIELLRRFINNEKDKTQIEETKIVLERVLQQLPKI